LIVFTRIFGVLHSFGCSISKLNNEYSANNQNERWNAESVICRLEYTRSQFLSAFSMVLAGMIVCDQHSRATLLSIGAAGQQIKALWQFGGEQ
jgi:hypothetical protein